VVEVNVIKPGEMTDIEKAGLKEQIRAGCRNMGTNSMYTPPGQKVGMFIRTSFGLCADCGHFNFIATQYKILRAVCDQHDFVVVRLAEDQPVTECSSYYTKGEQDAHDYSKNAWILDPESKKVGMI
jgi:hypothetical protein